MVEAMEHNRKVIKSLQEDFDNWWIEIYKMLIGERDDKKIYSD